MWFRKYTMQDLIHHGIPIPGWHQRLTVPAELNRGESPRADTNSQLRVKTRRRWLIRLPGTTWARRKRTNTVGPPDSRGTNLHRIHRKPPTTGWSQKRNTKSRRSHYFDHSLHCLGAGNTLLILVLPSVYLFLAKCSQAPTPPISWWDERLSRRAPMED